MSPSLEKTTRNQRNVDEDPLTLIDDSLKEPDEAFQLLQQFLERCEGTFQEPRRCECPSCGASRSIYCYDCCEVLLPMDQRPDGLQELSLPFSVDFVLDDRRASATGVQAVSVLKQITNGKNVYRLLDQSVTTVDGEGIPDYSAMEGAYFLFPSDTSVSLSSVASQVRHLVVLDCKWSKSHLRKDPRLLSLPKVHLDSQPQESFYWRWHNSGKGMLSTIEALYFAAWQVAEQNSWTLEQRRPLVNLCWVFGVQRAVIRRQYEIGNGHSIIPYFPFTEDGKECARKLRNKEDSAAKINPKNVMKN